jgi:hypothetical protein
MVVSVGILFRIVVEKAERFAQQKNVVRLAGEKRPARSYSMLLCKRLEVARRVFLWTEGNGVEKDVATDATF